MYNSKFHWILTAVIASSVLFYSCPPSEEVEPTPPDPQAQADAALQLGKLALSAVKSDGGTFTNSSLVSNVKFSLSEIDKQDVPDGFKIRLDSITVNNKEYTLPTADKKTISINSDKASFTLPVNNLINLIGTAGVVPDSFTFNIKGEYSLTSPSVYSTTPYSRDINAGSVSGTLNAIINVAKHFLPSGTVINGGIGTVSTLNSGSAGTLYAGDTLGGSIVLPFVDDGTGLKVEGMLPAGGSVNSYKIGSTTVGLLNGGSITGGSETSVTQAGSLVLTAVKNATNAPGGSITAYGTLAICDIGSLSEAGGGSGLAQIYFGNSSPSAATNLVLSAGGVWYTVPQFGVLVTVYR